MPVTSEIGTLPNGLRVVTTPLPTAQSVSVSVFVGAGSRGETERTNGVAHFLEHMVFKGTPARPSAIEIAEAIEGAGGVLNAYTSKELTCYWNHVPFDKIETAMDVLSDMLYNSVLDPEEIDRERTVVQQEIRRTKDQPGAWAAELLGSAFYGDQPMGWSIAGSEETVAGIQQQDFKDWMGAWYGASNVVLSVAGNTTHAQVMELAERLFAGGKEGTAPDVVAVNGNIPARRASADARDITQANVALGIPAVSRHDPDRYPLTILNALLGRGMSSRLFKEVRERRGLAYSVGSSVSRHSDSGMLGISAGVSPENLSEAVKVIFVELEKLTQETIGHDELTKARDYSIGSFRLSLESSMALGQRAGESLLMMGEVEPIDDVVGKLQAVESSDLLRVAQRILSRDRATLAVVGPNVEEDHLAAMLA